MSDTESSNSPEALPRTDGSVGPGPAARLAPFRRLPVRRFLRALHRDAGYLVVGLTFVYATSGLAVNHIADWDPNFTQIEREHRVDGAAIARLAGSPDAPAFAMKSARALLVGLDRDETIADAYALDATHVDVTLASSTLHVDLATGVVREEGQEERFFLRLSNWLHLNRGKKAWTFVADGYALLLLFLATSGLFVLPNQRGLFGRRNVLVLTGALVPILYVVWSGGPG